MKKLLMVLLAVFIGMISVSTVSSAGDNICQKELGDCFYNIYLSKDY